MNAQETDQSSTMPRTTLVSSWRRRGKKLVAVLRPTSLRPTALPSGKLLTLAISSLLPVTMEPPCIAKEIAPTKAGITYSTTNTTPLLLDLYIPEDQAGPAPLVVWVHGGAWRAGTRTRVPIKGLLKHGLAIASVDYRLSGDAAFPAQIHDINHAITYLRQHAATLGLDPKRFSIAGSSAGGHLATLAGVSSNVAGLLPPSANDLPISPKTLRVSSIVSLFGASNLETILQQSTPHGLSVRIPALQLLLRGQPEQKAELARLASPVTHVDGDDPPLLLLHGDQDPQMPINQSHELEGAYQQAGGQVHFEVVHGGEHGGNKFYTDAQILQIADFIKASFAE